jgi:hypothetical protein
MTSQPSTERQDARLKGTHRIGAKQHSFRILDLIFSYFVPRKPNGPSVITKLIWIQNSTSG